MFFRVPPCSGKSAMCTLLFKEFSKDETFKHVVHVSCLSNAEKSFADTFQTSVRYEWTTFFNNKDKRVLIVDETQKTYSDVQFWEAVKLTMQNDTLRIILFSAYGSNDPYRVGNLLGTPVIFIEAQKFGFENDEQGKPGLYLTRPEFDEMCVTSIVGQFDNVADKVWSLCGRHIGVAYFILAFFYYSVGKISSQIPEEKLIEIANSKRLVDDLKEKRGFPNLEMVNTACEGLTDEQCKLVFQILDSLAGDFNDIANISTYPEITRLVRCGILFEDSTNLRNQYRFASPMHRKTWMTSRYNDRYTEFKGKLVDFLIDAVSRMRGKTLKEFAKVNSGSIRESQVQQEFYRAISSSVPLNVPIIPEWEAVGEPKSYVDYSLDLNGKHWLIEFLVNGNRAKDHFERFQPGGKYHASFGMNSDYLLVDFRSKDVQLRKEKTLYIVFCDEFNKFKVFGEGVEHTRTVFFGDSIDEEVL
jgi:hypothetical protein